MPTQAERRRHIRERQKREFIERRTCDRCGGRKRADRDVCTDCFEEMWWYGDHCDRCGKPFNGWVNHYEHGRVCERCDVEMHQRYPYHGVRGYPAHQLDTEGQA